MKDEQPLARGRTQTIYQYPLNRNLLIKVRDREKLKAAYDRKLGGMIGFKRRHGIYTTWRRELDHYFTTCLRLGYAPDFLQRYHGVIETDLGLGLVVGRVADRSGDLAPTLAQVVSSTGLTDRLLSDVRDLARQMNELKISTNDLSVTNIVYGWNEYASHHLVVIEGIGVNTVIPFARYSDFFNRRSNDRHFARVMRSLEKFDRAFSERNPTN